MRVPAQSAKSNKNQKRKNTHLVPIYLIFGIFISHVYVNSVLHFPLKFSFFQWRFDPIPGHDLPVRDFGITPIGPITIGRIPPDERSARSRDLSLETHNTQQRQASVLPAGFETTVPASVRLQTHALDCAVTGIGFSLEISRDI